MKNEEPMNWKNIVSPLYERAKSPLYGSFMVSWLLWNWKIVFVVIFISKYSLEGLNLDKYILKYYWGPWDGVVIPLVLACIYLFLLPSVDNGIAIFRAKAKKRREVKEIAINRNSREVSGEEHYQLNLKYIAERNRVLDFEKQLDAESLKTREAEHSLSQLEKSYQELAGNAEDRNTELETIKTEHRRLLNRHAIPNTFQGRWTYTHTSPENPTAPE